MSSLYCLKASTESFSLLLRVGFTVVLSMEVDFFWLGEEVLVLGSFWYNLGLIIKPDSPTFFFAFWYSMEKLYLVFVSYDMFITLNYLDMVSSLDIHI